MVVSGFSEVYAGYGWGVQIFTPDQNPYEDYSLASGDTYAIPVGDALVARDPLGSLWTGDPGTTYHAYVYAWWLDPNDQTVYVAGELDDEDQCFAIPFSFEGGSTGVVSIAIPEGACPVEFDPSGE